MIKNKVLSFVFMGLLSLPSPSYAIFQFFFPSFFDNVFGPRISRPPLPALPTLNAHPNTLSAQAGTIAASQNQLGRHGQEVITSTLMPSSVVHVPLTQKADCDLAQEIKAIDLPKTIEEALKKKKDTDGPIFVNINLNGQTVTKSSATAHSTQMGDTVEWLKKLKERASDSYQSTTEWIKNNKKRFILYCLAGTYCAIQAYLWYLTVVLQKSTCWSRWKNHCSLEDLYRCKQSELIQEVLQEAHGRLQNKTIDNGLALTLFVREADQEIRLLNAYRSAVSTIDRLYMRTIFFYSTSLYQEVADRINRLLFIKNSILAAVSDVKKTALSAPEINVEGSSC